MQFAVHTFNHIDEANFDITDYSKLKFGSHVVAKKFGKEMAIKFFREHKHILELGECLVIPSAYNMVEIAATMLAREFIKHLNVILVENGLPIAKWTSMHRTITYFSDYAHMTQDERKQMLSGDSFFINKDFIKNKILLFIDDVIITGTHEEKIKEFLAINDITNPVMYLYYCKYTGGCPNTEAKLNTCGVNDVDSYIQLINEPNHHIIVRTCKFLLNGDRHQLLDVMSRAPHGFIDALYTACIMEEYHKVPRYRENMDLIKKYKQLVCV